ncbi:disulfide bond formation protein B [Thiocystis violacea]|uniref:disulfide bond formation protein B n=1 Tax=Thiocystis violacea TaxID=13725 RepID=UPI0019074385|nr:disulfide bond formation protein B [Thiocystis violacea]MBK1719914.1 disulfide bond formation protein B [Thiocystis violacea]
MTTISPHLTWILLSLASAALVLASLLLTPWLELEPCHLCVFQRLLFMLIAVLALGAALSAGRVRFVLGALLALTAAAGTATAAYQSWLQEYAAGSVSCVASEMGPIERLIEWLGQQAPTLFLATGFCEDKALVLLGLSMAQWALLFFIGMLAMTVWQLRANR